MKLTLNIEKKHLYFLTAFVILIGVGVVIATGWNGQQSHPTLFTDIIAARTAGPGTVTVNDDLSLQTGKSLCLNGVCQSTWPPGGGTLSGTGTANYLTKWIGANSIGNSIISESLNTATVNGDLVIQSTNGITLGGVRRTTWPTSTTGQSCFVSTPNYAVPSGY